LHTLSINQIRSNVLIQDAVFKLEPMAALKVLSKFFPHEFSFSHVEQVKSRHIRSAFLAIDPNRPLQTLEDNLQVGFGMPQGCKVLRWSSLNDSCKLFFFVFTLFDSEDVVSLEDFMLLFSYGTMRLYSTSASGNSKNETISEK
jgi:hypothetical protein